jgi:2-phospho-L-lactate guanylyltransferase
VLVPQKSLARAKGRLALEPCHRRAVAEAMLRDTVAAIAATGVVGRVLVLWDDESDRGTLPGVDGLGTPRRRLNEAIGFGAARTRQSHPRAGIAVVPGDLPALTSDVLTRCLDEAAAHPRAFLRDASGTGTTLLTAAAGTDLAPAYGPGSAGAHARSGAHPIEPTDLEAARADVDDLSSLERALALGCGRHTRSTWLGLGLALR